MSGLSAMFQSDACQSCYDTCDSSNYWCDTAAVATFAADPVAGGIALAACAGTYFTCDDGCAKPGAPCCAVQCGADVCCATGQSCCNGLQTGNACCDSGSVCVAGPANSGTIYPYAYCCPGGSDPKGCQVSDTGGDTALYCRQPNQTCCGVWGACASGQYCANGEYFTCCPNGQVFCSGACCNGTCMTLNAGTNAENQVCCPTQNVCGNSCCAPNQTCLTSPAGQKICCGEQPLCGAVCCESPATCVNGRCGVGAPCGNTFCGFGTCCGGICCATACINDVCCPTQSTCGSICCTAGQVCSNGKCVSGCPDGMDFSRAPDGTVACCPLYQCNNPSNDNICTEASCPGGVCCGQNQVCCPTTTAGARYKCLNPPCPTIVQ